MVSAAANRCIGDPQHGFTDQSRHRTLLLTLSHLHSLPPHHSLMEFSRPHKWHLVTMEASPRLPFIGIFSYHSSPHQDAVTADRGSSGSGRTYFL